MAKLQTAVNKVKRLEEQTNPVNNMPEGLGAGSINTAMRDLPAQSVQPTAQQPSQADLYAIQEKRRLQALETQKRNALATLKQEKAQVNPAFHTGLSNIAGQSAQQARTLAEYLAQRGQTQSGIAAQSEMQRNSDLMSQQGMLEQQRANALTDIARRESGVQSAYDSGALDASMERQYNSLQGQLTAQQQARQEGIATVGQYYDDYAKQLNQIAQMEAMGDYSQSYLKPYLTMARQEKMAGQAEAQAKAEQQEFENWLAVQKLNNSRGGGTSTQTTDTGMTKDEAFGYDYNRAASGLTTPQEIERNRESLVGQYGLSKYNQILKAAQNYLGNLSTARNDLLPMVYDENGYGDEIINSGRTDLIDALNRYYEQYPNAPIKRNQLMEQGLGTSWKGRYY